MQQRWPSDTHAWASAVTISIKMQQCWLSDTHAWASAVRPACLALLISFILMLLYTIVYRAFFHPMAKYPGPLIAKFTNLYAAYHSWIGDIHVDMYRCHLKYGDRVRYAPNRVMFNIPEALQAIYGHGNNVKKAKGYDALATQAQNTLTLTDKAQHASRRRLLSQAFSQSSLRQFEPTIRSRIDRFCQVLRSFGKSGGQWTEPIDISHQFAYLAFDTLTALAFDTDLQTMTDPTHRFIFSAIASVNVRLGVTYQARELTFHRMDRKILLNSAISASKFVSFLRKMMRKRLEKGSNCHDMFSFLQKCKDPETGKGLTPMELSSEAATLVVAGTDTTASALAAISHYLTSSSRCYRRAAEEVRTTFATVDEIGLGPKLNSCVFLRACIDEALRLSPPAGSAGWREVDHGGTVIGGEFLSPGTEVGVCLYSIQHHPHYWDDPFSYKPERWLESSNDLSTPTGSSKTRPYAPFSMGPRSCVGKPLANAQTMLTFASLLWQFDMRRADSEENWMMKDITPTEYNVKQHLTAHKNGPILCFRPRFQSELF